MRLRASFVFVTIAALVVAYVFGCSGAGGDTRSDGAEPGGDGGASGPDDSGAATDAACTALGAREAARAALDAGASTVFVDCAHAVQYTRTVSADGGIATEQITRTTGSRAAWDFTGDTKTYRYYPTAAASVASHAIDLTVAPTAGDDGGLGVATFVYLDDTNGDDVPDQRTTWVVDPASTTIAVTVETDPQQNGSWSTQSSDLAPLDQPEVTIDTTSGDPGACDSNAAQKLSDALGAAYDDVDNCLTAVAPDVVAQLDEMALSTKVVVACSSAPPDNPAVCAETNVPNAIRRWFGGVPTITFYPNGVAEANGCDPVAPTLLHEMMHIVLGPHTHGDGSKDPADRIYNCERTCGAPAYATSQTCAACNGGKNDPGNAQCKQFPFVPCDGGDPVYCRCQGGNGWYGDMSSCIIGCPTGLSCFVDQCEQAYGPCR